MSPGQVMGVAFGALAVFVVLLVSIALLLNRRMSSRNTALAGRHGWQYRPDPTLLPHL